MPECSGRATAQRDNVSLVTMILDNEMRFVRITERSQSCDFERERKGVHSEEKSKDRIHGVNKGGHLRALRLDTLLARVSKHKC